MGYGELAGVMNALRAAGGLEGALIGFDAGAGR